MYYNGYKIFILFHMAINSLQMLDKGNFSRILKSNLKYVVNQPELDVLMSSLIASLVLSR